MDARFSKKFGANGTIITDRCIGHRLSPAAWAVAVECKMPRSTVHELPEFPRPITETNSVPNCMRAPTRSLETPATENVLDEASTADDNVTPLGPANSFIPYRLNVPLVTEPILLLSPKPISDRTSSPAPGAFNAKVGTQVTPKSGVCPPRAVRVSGHSSGVLS